MPKLIDVAEVNPRLDRFSINDSEEIVSFVPMASVSEVHGAITHEENRPLFDVIRGFTPFKDGDILVAKITPCFENGKIAHARITRRFGFGSTEFHVVRPLTQNLDQRYLYHFLRQPKVREEGASRMTGSGGQKRVPKAFLEDLDIPLPPLPKQRFAATILDKADALRNRRREIITKLDSLMKSVFLDMFGDPTHNAMGWPVVSFSELIRVKSGNGLTAKEMNHEGPFLVYGGNGASGMHSEYMFEAPQIIIGRVGAYCGVVHRTKPESWVTDNALYISEVVKPINERFLQEILALADFNQYAGRAAQPLVSGSRIYPVLTIYPPRRLQDAYEQKVLRIAELLDRAHESHQLLDALFLSLQDAAFAGKL